MHWCTRGAVVRPLTPCPAGAGAGAGSQPCGCDRGHGGRPVAAAAGGGGAGPPAAGRVPSGPLPPRGLRTSAPPLRAAPRRLPGRAGQGWCRGAAGGRPRGSGHERAPAARPALRAARARRRAPPAHRCAVRRLRQGALPGRAQQGEGRGARAQRPPNGRHPLAARPALPGADGAARGPVRRGRGGEQPAGTGAAPQPPGPRRAQRPLPPGAVLEAGGGCPAWWWHPA